MLGKWSMLDVFVIAVTIVIVKVGGSFAKAEPRPGLYVFSLAVFLSMILTGRVHKLAAREARP
jgi:paraquat-inducible protein A